ncbi:alpha/beta fold hydrolase [Paenibacillus sp. AR247]|uniref:alpha/beta fold hydrolase n=1 Tax=Paenibacillus sp. AR247 TaxID=1631599 RepID=UPI0035BE4667
MLNHLRQPVSFTVTGGGGVKLHVEESGNVHGRPLLFLHGGSQCSLCWKKQIHSELALDYRLVTMDFRGHGQSDKPAQGYADGRLWAEDIHSVIREMGLIQPVLVGWSFAGIPLLESCLGNQIQPSGCP